MDDTDSVVCKLQSAIGEIALAEGDPLLVVKAFGRRLREFGVPVSRLCVAWRALDPLIYAQQLIWTRSTAVVDDFSHDEAQEARARDVGGPLRHVTDNQLPLFRWDLTLPILPFPEFEEFAAAGHTEYVAGVENFAGTSDVGGNQPGVFVSICSDAPSGFGDALEIFLRVRPVFALAMRALISERKIAVLARTYLGPLAAQRVLAGSIQRGDAEVIPAAIWYSDMRSFTPLSEGLALDDTIQFLNEVFEATAGAVEAVGGHVLDFIGDAVLAIFPLADDGMARSLAALEEALRRMDAVRAAHADDPRPGIMTTLQRGLVGIAVAVGDVRFGNIGTRERLTFSVIGPTVNIVARIEGMTKVLGETVLVTEAVARAAPDRFVPRGTHELEGVAEPPALFAPAAAWRCARAADLPASQPVTATVV